MSTAHRASYAVTALFPIDRAGNVAMTPFSKSIAVNHPPIAVADSVRRTCPATDVAFSASRSFDNDGFIAGFKWDFGDGNTAEGMDVKHQYSEPGRYTATVTVTDNLGLECSTAKHTVQIDVNSAPKANAGEDAIVFIGGAVDGHILDGSQSTDADGDALQYRWKLSDGSEYEGQRTRADFFDGGKIEAELTVSDPHGLACSASKDSVKLNVMRRLEPGLPAN